MKILLLIIPLALGAAGCVPFMDPPTFAPEKAANENQGHFASNCPGSLMQAADRAT